MTLVISLKDHRTCRCYRGVLSDAPFSPAMQSELESRKRTIIALVAASAISLLMWGIVVALNVQ